MYNRLKYHTKRAILNLYFLFLMYINFIIYNIGFNMQYKRRHRNLKTFFQETIKVTLSLLPIVMVYWIL